MRTAGRWLVLVTALVLAWPLRRESPGSVVLPTLSPFITLVSVISVWTLSLWMLVVVPVLMLVLFFPRWFCRYACPTGMVQEWVEKLRPQASGWLKWPAVGQWLVGLTLGGALFGYPIFLWLDPLAIFNGFLNAWRQPLALATLLTGIGLPLLLLLDWAAPRLWCRRLCPLGATQDLLAWPQRWLGAKPRAVEPSRVNVAREFGHGRRWFLTLLAGAVGALTIKTVRGHTPRSLRPPGALAETCFTGVCVRCGNCGQVCPSRIIQPDYGVSGWTGFFTPSLRFEADYCREDCQRCTEVCPSGALARLALGEKRQFILGQAAVDLELCLLAQGRECTACIQKCPYHALILQSADGGFSNEPRVRPDLCNGCGACEVVCPTRPVRAIRVRPPALPGASSSSQNIQTRILLNLTSNRADNAQK